MQQQPWMAQPTPVTGPPKWLWMLPLFSCGLFGFVPALVVAAKAKKSRAWCIAGTITLAWFLGFGLVVSQPEGSDNAISDAGALLYLGAWIGGTVFSLILASQLNWSKAAVLMGPPPHDPNAAAIAGVEVARSKRDEARAIAARDPMMARELRIGRPDLQRYFDDGGLIDVNSAPAQVLIHGLALTAAEAAQVIATRQHLRRLEHVEDLINLAGLDVGTVDRVRDRVILM